MPLSPPRFASEAVTESCLRIALRHFRLTQISFRVPDMDETPISELSALRHEYDAHGLRRAVLHSDPIEQFRAWFAAALAADIRDVNAMSLATATPDGKPSVRIVLLKRIDRRGFSFFTNYDSEKARHLEANPFAELAFYWVKVERQIRIRGSVERTSR